MDERTLDRIARSAGILRNHIPQGEVATIFSEAPNRELPKYRGSMESFHEFASEVLELVAEMRRRDEQQREILRGLKDAAMQDFADRCANPYTVPARPPVAEAVTISTDDVTPDLFAPVANLGPSPLEAAYAQWIKGQPITPMPCCDPTPAPEFSFTINGQAFAAKDIEIVERRWTKEDVLDLEKFLLQNDIHLYLSHDDHELCGADELYFTMYGSPYLGNNEESDEDDLDFDDEDDWEDDDDVCPDCGEPLDDCTCDDEEDDPGVTIIDDEGEPD